MISVLLDIITVLLCSIAIVILLALFGASIIGIYKAAKDVLGKNGQDKP